MSSQGTDTAIQNFLTKLVDNIEDRIKSTGYAVPRSEIIGYLLEFFVVDGNLTEERLHKKRNKEILNSFIFFHYRIYLFVISIL